MYKNTSLDLRRYKHLQMFAHANSLIGEQAVEDGQTSLFIRLGSTTRTISTNTKFLWRLRLLKDMPTTPKNARIVWPNDNMLDIDLSLLTDTKNKRNKQKALGLTSYAQLYSEYDPHVQI